MIDMPIADFWFQKNTGADEETLSREIDKLPPLADLSALRLKVVICTLAFCRKPDRSRNLPSPGQLVWDKKRNGKNVSFGMECLNALLGKIHGLLDSDCMTLLRAVHILHRNKGAESAPIIAEIFDRLQASLPNMSAKNMSMLARELSFTPKAPNEGFLTAFLNTAQFRMPSFTANNSASLLWGLSNLHMALPEKFLHSVLTPLPGKLTDLGDEKKYAARTFSDIVIACANMNLFPSLDFFKDLYALAEKHLPSFEARHLSSIAWAGAHLGAGLPPSYLKKFYAETENKFAAFSPSQIVQTLWATTVLSVIGPLPKNAKKFIDDALSVNPDLLKPGEKNAFALACLRFRPELAKTFNVPPQENIVSLCEQTFGEKLEDAGFILSEKGKILRTLHKEIDFVAQAGTKTVLIEFDGPQHFINNMSGTPYTFTGGSQLMAAILLARQPDSIVLRAPYWVNRHLRRADLIDLRIEMEAAAPGAYYLSRDSGTDVYGLSKIPLQPPPVFDPPPSRPGLNVAKQSAHPVLQ